MAYAEDIKEEDLVEKVVQVTRVKKTVKGGSIVSYAALTVVGDREGRIGIGRGKARETVSAIQKAMQRARLNMETIELNGDTLWYPINERHGASKVFMAPASEGTGIIAGATMRAVFEAVGVNNVLAKSFGSTTPVNVVKATLKALKNMRSPEEVAARRGKSVEELAVLSRV